MSRIPCNWKSYINAGFGLEASEIAGFQAPHARNLVFGSVQFFVNQSGNENRSSQQRDRSSGRGNTRKSFRRVSPQGRPILAQRFSAGNAAWMTKSRRDD